MISFPNAKINIGLFVTEKRIDGFHNLESIFYPIQWNDALEIISSDKLEFTTTGLTIDGNSEENLCMKAYHLLKKDFQLPPIKAHLHKVIPMGAGMGGGSADAAFMLQLLNSEFNLALSNEKLQSYSRKLGSDCAFFIDNKPVFAFNKGDEFETIHLDLTDKKILCIYPNIHVTTAQAYGGITPKKAPFELKKIAQLPISEWKNHIFNDFEKHIFKLHPTLQQIKEDLYSKGALYAAMSGSGSTIYGIFNHEINYCSKSLFLQGFPLSQYRSCLIINYRDFKIFG